jgi:hypothetical protein
MNESERLEGAAREWFPPWFRVLGWALMGASAGYEALLIRVNGPHGLPATLHILFFAVLLAGVYLGPAWLFYALVQASVSVVRRRARARRDELALLVLGAAVVVWHFASYYVLAD